MSRSFKFPMFKLRNSKKYKKLSNKKIRKFKDIIGGKFFKKILNPWNICDYKSYPIEKDTAWFTKDDWTELINKTKRK